MPFQPLLSGAFALLMLTLSGPTWADNPPSNASPFNQLVILGDSLSDSGNNAALLYPQGLTPTPLNSDHDFSKIPYLPSGTYSNGPVWSQDFAQRMGLSATPFLLGGSNYAFGGAQVSADGTDGPGGFPFSVTKQLGMYMQTSQGQANANALFVVAAGANDARAVLEQYVPGTDPSATIQAAAQAYAQGMGSIVDHLQQAGARHIVVWNIPDFGLTPFANSLGASAASFASVVSGAMNTALAQRMAAEGPAVSLFDVSSLLHNTVANAQTLGFSDVVHACGAASNNCDPNTSLFYDAIHPTAKGHALLADAMFNSISAVPEASSFAMMALGLALLGWQGRRSRQRQARPAAPAALG